MPNDIRHTEKWGVPFIVQYPSPKNQFIKTVGPVGMEIAITRPLKHGFTTVECHHVYSLV